MYTIKPFTNSEERILVREGIPFKRKGNVCNIATERDFVRAAFNLMLPFLPTERDFVKEVL